MPGLYNTWLFQFIVNGSDIIEVGHLENATIIEDAGSILPTFECSFTHKSTDILQYLNEGNVITLRIGRNQGESVSGKYRIHSVRHNNIGNGGISIYVNGIYDALPFLQNSKARSFPNKTSSEVISEIGKEYFRVDNRVSTSDNMNWIQTGICDKKFMNDVWIHSYGNSGTTMVLGITADGVLRVRTIKDIMSSYSIVFGPGGEYVDPNYSLSQNTTWNNYNGGYGQIRVQDDIEKGTGGIVLSDQSAQGSQNTKTPRTSKASPRIMQTRFKNSNIHEHYWEAQSANLSRLLALNNITLTFTYKNFFHDVHVLDCIKFTEVDERGLLDTTITGNYMITKISRTVRDNQLMTLIQCSRENINNSKGDFLSSIFSGIPSDFARGLIGAAMSDIGSIRISSNISIDGGLVIGALSNLTSGNVASKALQVLGSSLRNSKYVQSYNNLISALQNPYEIKSMLLSSVPGLREVDSRINQILNFDAGGLLDNVLGQNLPKILGNGSLESFFRGEINKLASSVLSKFGVSISDLIGPMNLAYRNPIDATLNELLSTIKNLDIDLEKLKI